MPMTLFLEDPGFDEIGDCGREVEIQDGDVGIERFVARDGDQRGIVVPSPADERISLLLPVDLDLREAAFAEPFRQDDVKVRKVRGDQLLGGRGLGMLFHEGEFFRGGDDHRFRAGRGQPVAVLAGMVDLEPVGVVLDGPDAIAATCQLGQETLNEGRLARFRPGDEGDGLDGGGHSFKIAAGGGNVKTAWANKPSGQRGGSV